MNPRQDSDALNMAKTKKREIGDTGEGGWFARIWRKRAIKSSKGTTGSPGER